MPFDKLAVGRTIRALRKERRLSQEVLSGLAGIARTHLTMIETGAINASLETLWKIAAALDMRPSALIEKIEGEIAASGASADAGG